MRASKKILGPASFLLMAVFLTAGRACMGQDTASDKEQKEDAAGFKEFTSHVQEYVKLHKAVEAKLPVLKPTDLPEMITAHQQALARKIREARPRAKPGDIFSKEAREAFRHTIRSAFQGAHASNARATIQQGAPLKETHLDVNGMYPDRVPYTTVPPTLLQKFPKLPDEVAYRIVGRDLVLIDVRANLVVDVISEIFPKM
jgi:hypothetical protein